MKPVYCLTEYSSLLIDYKLSPSEREYLHHLSLIGREDSGKRKFYFSELINGLQIETQSWVGVIELHQARIQIQPKFNRTFLDLIDMICFVEQIPFHFMKDTVADLEQTDWLELFVRLFLNQLNRLWKQGLSKEYVTEEDNLRHLRGRPDLAKNLIVNKGFPDSIYCRYDELVNNIPENQVILTALHSADRYSLQPDTKQKLHQFRSQFEQICEPYPFGSWPDFTYHRLNAHYQPVHRLAKYLVQQTSIKNLYGNRHQNLFSLLINMNELFEQFVCTLLKKYLPPGFRVETQKKITEAIQMDGKSYRYIIPDLRVTDPTGKQLVMDIKYKDYSGKRISNDDIYQLAFYALYHHQSLGEPYLTKIIHPVFHQSPQDREIVIDLMPGTPFSGFLKVVSLSVESILDKVRKNDREGLRETALSLVG